jgi:hypothetical protein
MEEAGGWVGDDGLEIRLIPHMADPLFRLAYTLYRISMDYPGRLEFPAGLSFAAVATLESYMNEVISMRAFLPGQTDAEQEPARRRVRGPRADVVGRLRRLREEAKRPDALPESTLDDVQILVGLRGLLAHYDVQGEHPAETRTSLQRLAERVRAADQSAGDVSLEQILIPPTAAWMWDLVQRVIRELYAAGYGPPRPHWYQIVDPAQFEGGPPLGVL